MTATVAEYEKILENISDELNSVARCACVACNSCTCSCSCRNIPEEDNIEW